MGKSLAEFVEKYTAVQHLIENLNANMEVYCIDWTDERKADFLRINMIMIRQCLNDFGAE